MAEKAPAFQFYPKDFLGDARQAAMSLQEAGAYIRLMCSEWNEQGQGIPDNPIKCARIVGTTDTVMRKMWMTLRACFKPHPVDAAMLIHPRLQKERDKQETYRRRQSDKGKASAAARQAKPQPDANHGSTAVQPEANSPISYLLSSNFREKQERPRAPGGSIIGRNQHLDHAACGPDFVWCVPSAVHRKFAEALAPKFGGDREAAKDALQQWYPTIWQGLPAGTVIGDAFKFWQPLFDAAFANASPPAAGKITTRLASAMANIKASGE